MKKKILVFTAILTLSLGIMTACGSKDTNNSATSPSGGSSEPAVTDDAGNVIDDAVDDAGDAVKDVTDDVTNGIEDATDDMTGNGDTDRNR